jgi:hypothetical protein
LTSVNVIIVNERCVRITYNLEAALQQIRSTVETRQLWVDAIRIDQENADEKSEPIKIMARIYRQGKPVLSWLGQDDPYVDPAFDALEMLCWSTKALLYRYCSVRNDIPVSQVNEAAIQSVVHNDELEGSWTEPSGALMEALALMPVSFSEFGSLSAIAWGHSANHADWRETKSLITGDLLKLGDLAVCSLLSTTSSSVGHTGEDFGYFKN